MVAVAVCTFGCATYPTPRMAGLGNGPSFMVGELEIMVYDRERVERVCRAFDVNRRAAANRPVWGCYFAAERRIVTTENIYVLIHELKHAAEPAWRHPHDGRD